MNDSAHSPEMIARVRQGMGLWVTEALKRLEQELPWYRELPAQERSYVGLVAQAGIASFVRWFADPSGPATGVREMFAAAPRELTQSVSLRHALQLVRLVVDTVEDHAAAVVGSDEGKEVADAVLRFSREVAFSAAEIYARSAEQRGAWDARLEALVIDAVVRADEDTAQITSRAAALGWTSRSGVVVLAGNAPAALGAEGIASLRRAARRAAPDALVGLHGEQVIVILGGDEDLLATATSLIAGNPPGDDSQVVIGPVVDGIEQAGASAAAALSGLRAAPGWPGAPRPALATELLPERVLGGDGAAGRELRERAYVPLAGTPEALATLDAYLETGRSLEATARRLFVHPNTVRYRLRKVAGITGWDPTDPREAYVLQIALALSRLNP